MDDTPNGGSPSTPEGSEEAPPTRVRLLSAGVELMLEHPIGTGLSHVKATEVSRRAGLSHGAFYHHWASQEDFQDELIDHVLSLGRNTSEVAAFVRRMTDIDQGQPVESLRNAMNASFEDSDLVPWRLWLALVARNDPAIDAQLAERYRDLLDAFKPTVQSVFDDLGLRVRAPVDMQRIVVLADALWEGLALRHTIDPELVDGQAATDEHGDPWSLYALGVAVMLLGALEPDPSKPGELTEEIRRFWLDPGE